MLCHWPWRWAPQSRRQSTRRSRAGPRRVPWHGRSAHSTSTSTSTSAPCKPREAAATATVPWGICPNCRISLPPPPPGGGGDGYPYPNPKPDPKPDQASWTTSRTCSPSIPRALWLWSPTRATHRTATPNLRARPATPLRPHCSPTAAPLQPGCPQPHASCNQASTLPATPHAACTPCQVRHLQRVQHAVGQGAGRDDQEPRGPPRRAARLGRPARDRVRGAPDLDATPRDATPAAGCAL